MQRKRRLPVLMGLFGAVCLLWIFEKNCLENKAKGFERNADHKPADPQAAATKAQAEQSSCYGS